MMPELPHKIALPSNEQRALAVVSLAREGRFEEIRQQFAPMLRRLVSERALREAWGAEVTRYGALRRVGEPVVQAAHAGVVVARVALGFERGLTTLAISMRRGRLVGIRTIEGDATGATSDWEPAAYADPAAFVEQEHTIGTGGDAVPATLTLPRDDRPWAAAVLLPGSGPQDRDGTIGPNKPLKDLAWGLAGRGIAVVRFDKITYANPGHLQASPNGVTITDEYMPQARGAVRLLLDRPELAAERVVLIGHSLGGTVAPRIAATEPNVTGLVLLAAGAQRLHWAIVRQLRYLNALSSGASSQTVDVAVEQARLIDSPDLSLNTPSSELPFGVPASYWLDLRGYDPVGTAAALEIPILIVQGGRDYQVTVDDDLALWRAGLNQRPQVSINVYPEHDHMLARGTGPSKPGDYDRPQHIDADIIAAITAWIRAT